MNKLLKWIVMLLSAGVLAAAAGVGGLYLYFAADLPGISSLKEYKPPVITNIYSRNGEKIAEFCDQRRIVIPLSEMTDSLVNAFIAAEDARFYEHEGIDFHSIIRAFFKNLEAGRIVQGGSTITQQVAKSFFLTPERSYSRKIKEAILAYRIDRRFSKKQILYLYLNQIYLGHGAYGVEAAARVYFGRHAGELGLAECAMLAGLPQAPSRYSPHSNPELAKQRQIYVLNQMKRENMISGDQAAEAIEKELEFAERRDLYFEKVPYYSEHVRRFLVENFGREKVYKGGLNVYTSVDVDMQEAGRKALQKGLYAHDKRRGYRGPIKHLPQEKIETFSRKIQEEIDKRPLQPGRMIKGVVIDVNNAEKRCMVKIGGERGVLDFEDMSWAKPCSLEEPGSRPGISRPGDVLSEGDVILVKIKRKKQDDSTWQVALEQKPKAQAALLCLETGTGKAVSMIGGRNFSESQFNRAVQSRRQPGSAFKPVIYAAAIDKGYTPATVVFDSPIVFRETKKDFTWKPKNYDETFHGPTLLRTGLIKSRNIVTVKILREIGIDYAIEYARKLGIESRLDRDLSLALGSSGVSLLEIVRVYSVFANQGKLVEPVFVTRVEDRDGSLIYKKTPAEKQVVDKSTAYIMTHLLKEVVKYGTGWRVKALGRPVAGKTGTTNNLHDAWFVGYTPRFVAGVWVGYDKERSLGSRETGSRAASPIWLEFMKNILKGRPEKVFPVPEDVVFTKIDLETGLLPIAESERTAYECFREGTAPEKHTEAPDVVNSDEFFKQGFN